MERNKAEQEYANKETEEERVHWLVLFSESHFPPIYSTYLVFKRVALARLLSTAARIRFCAMASVVPLDVAVHAARAHAKIERT